MRVDTLRFRLRLLLLIVLLPLVVSLAQEIMDGYRVARAQLASEVRHIVDLIAHSEERKVAAAKQLMRALADTPQFRALSPDCQAVLDGHKGTLSPHTSVGLSDAAGNILCQVGATSGRRVGMSSVQAGPKSSGFVVQGYTFGAITGRPVRPMGYVFTDDAHRPLGTVHFALGLDWLAEVMSVYPLRGNPNATVFDEAGTILARHPSDDADGKTMPDATFVRLAANRGAEVEGSGADIDGQHRFYAIHPLFHTPQFHDDDEARTKRVYIALGVIEDSLYADVRSKALRTTSTVLATTMIALWLAWLIGSLSVVAHMHLIIFSARRI